MMHSQCEADLLKENERLRAALEQARDRLSSIRIYATDTLSGRADGPDDREWQRAGVSELAKRARLGLADIDTALASPAPSASEPDVDAPDANANAWIDGPPPKPYSSEWFIAVTTYGDRVVLRELPEEYSYQFRTADETYITRELIAKWMQFPDSQFIPFSPAPSTSAPGTDWRKLAMDFGNAWEDVDDEGEYADLRPLSKAREALIDAVRREREREKGPDHGAS